MAVIYINYYAYLVSIIAVLNIPVCYYLAVVREQVSPIFPFLSEMASLPPSSCFYSLFNSITAVSMWAMMWLNHSAVEDYICRKRNHEWKLIAGNHCSYYFGTVSCFNLVLVVNIQQTSELLTHCITAIFFFSFALLHMYAEVYMTYELNVSSTWTYLRIFRLSMAIVATVTIFSTCLFALITIVVVDKTKGFEFANLLPEHDGYIVHAIAAAAEWIFCLAYLLFFVCSFEEKTPLVIELPKVVYNPNADITADKFGGEIVEMKQL